MLESVGKRDLKTGKFVELKMQIFKFPETYLQDLFLFPPRRQSTPESLLEDHVRHGDIDNENENGNENEVNDLSKLKRI